ncbi:MAG: hypothetical protein ACREBO_10310 [Novosphingobium sp.]
MPNVETYQSANGIYRLTVTPRPIRSQLAYFESKVAESEGKAPPPAGSAMGLLERKGGDGNWETVWIAALRNEVAPVRVLVSDDGTRVATFDNWHGTGYGPNVVVIYGEAGKLVRAIALNELVPDHYIEALPHSVSSIWWAGEHRLTATTLVVAVGVPSPGLEINQTIPVEIALKDGVVKPPAGAEWQAALAAAEQVNATARAAELARRKYLTEPIVGPQTLDQRGWHDFLREAHARLVPNWLDSPSVSTTVLRDPAAKDYAVSETWVIEAISNEAGFPSDGAAFATIGPPENLVAVLGKAVRKIPRGALSGTPIYVAIDAAHLKGVKQALAPSGARLVWFDPNSPIPQRAERIPGSPEEAAANEARNDRIMNDMMGAAKEATGATRGM